MLLSLFKFIVFFYIIRFIVRNMGVLNPLPTQQMGNTAQTSSTQADEPSHTTVGSQWQRKAPNSDDYIDYEEVK
jgi:hypothetical protein